MRLSEIDWLGYGMLAVGLAALIVFMKQGDRFFWLDNPAIQHLGLLAAVAIPLALILLLLRRRPLLDLGLMATPTFGWAVATATRLQGFRIPEIAEANIWMFRSQCVGFPLAWFWASRGDARQPLSLLLFAAGALVCTYLTPQWQAGDFRLALILVGVGQDLFLVPTLFYATRDVKPEQGPTGIVANRKTRIGEYVAAGTRMLSIVPINDLWVEANYRETHESRRSGAHRRRYLSRQTDLRLCRSDFAGGGVGICAYHARQCHGQFHQDRAVLHRAHPVQCPRRQRRSRASRHVGGDRRRGPHTRQRISDRTRQPGRLLV